jgi:hypothetical protein
MHFEPKLVPHEQLHTHFILHNNCLPTKIKPMFDQTVIKKAVAYFILTIKNNKDVICLNSYLSVLSLIQLISLSTTNATTITTTTIINLQLSSSLYSSLFKGN